MPQSKPSARPFARRDPLAYWQDQETRPLLSPAAESASTAGGWWILPLVGMGALLWTALLWLLLA